MHFELFYKAVLDQGYPNHWMQFDPGATYNHVDAAARIAQCSFSGNHYIRIVRDGEIIFEDNLATNGVVDFMWKHGADPDFTRVTHANIRNNNL